jgi:hypothetical protein
MASRTEAVQAYVRAFCSGDQAASDEAATHIADDVDLVSPPLHVRGRAGVVERISGHWPGMGMYATAVWSPPAEDGDTVRVVGELAPDLPTKSISLAFSFNKEGKICHIDQVATRGSPPPPGDVRLTDEIKQLVNDSLDDGCPMVVGYMGADGQPQLSLRGSMRALSDTQLAFWVRNPNGGIVKALDYNPRITILYRDTPNRVNMLFQGRGRVETDEQVRNAVFESMPQIEQDHDEPRRGACMVIELDSVSGATLSGPVRMVRQPVQEGVAG